MFKLNQTIQFDHAIRPACLPEEATVPNGVIASGWGHTRYGGSGSSTLQKVDLEKFSKNEWMRVPFAAELGAKYDEQTMVFVGHHSRRKDTCQGDSGGPIQTLHYSHQCTYTVYGVTSTGNDCGVIGSPAIYTSVYSHLNWIESIVWPNQ